MLLGDVELDVVSVRVDGMDLPYAHVSRTERTVGLDRSGRADWELAELRLEARLPAAEIVEGPWSDVVCLAVLTEKATNSRITVRLDGTHGVLRGTLELPRGMYRERAVLALAVVATVGDVPGRLVGSTQQDWYVDLHSAVPKRRREVEIVEADFREGPYEWLRPFKDAPWVIETAAEPPTVYLNSAGVEGLPAVLGGKGGSPAERMLRDVVAGQIAQDAWTAMFHAASTDPETDEDGTPLIPQGWRGTVLRAMLPDVLPGLRIQDALREVDERRRRGAGWAELQTGVLYAAGRRGRTAKKLTDAVRTVDQGER
ncbi:hypothetical protein ACFYZT_19235 [Streptomyces sp. NPDC001591]|uniref:hypothetical protein n=1 Tax=Streptomyces sp. NPDC001591 TaxID=3364589 RepID=UPI0036936646